MSKRLHVTKRCSGEALVILPPSVATSLGHIPILADFFLTGAGVFPKADTLYRTRNQGYHDCLLIYCECGRGWFETLGRRQELLPDRALLLPAGLPHSYGPDEKDPWSLHWAAFNGPNALEYTRQLPPNRYSIPVAPETRAEVLELFARLDALLYDEVSTPHLICASKMLELMLGLLLYHNPAFRAQHAAQSDAIARAMQFMRQRLGTSVEHAELARQTGMSPNHFSRLFKRRIGYAPVDYFIRMKVQRACQYLSTSDDLIKTVASNLGYNDVAYFSRVFRKVMGTSPQKYRASR
jgi:AraC family transcriptional regulator of arabinose operon